MLILGLVSVALAHKPTFGDTFNSAESSYVVDDPNISIVVYQTITCEAPELWLEFDADDDFELYVQLGVPVIPGLAEYHPTVAVIAEGLPMVDNLPFDIPDGMGAVVYESEASPSEFFEPFTQTESWVWVEERLQVSGAGYIVGWHPEGFSGKMWLATGEVEDFSDVDPTEFIVWNELVNNFHETGQYEPPRGTMMGECSMNVETQPKSGCIVTPVSGATVWVSLMALLGIRRRRS